MNAAVAGQRHAPVRQDWLDLTVEPIVDPTLPIVDSHHHLWDKPGERYALEEISADTGSGHNIVATVFVEGAFGYWQHGPDALRTLGETEFATAIAECAAAGSIARIAHGIVAKVDLALGAGSGDVLDRHADLAAGRLRGVRFATAWHADPAARGSTRLAPPGQLYDPAVRAGLEELCRRDLVFDAWMYHTQLGDLVDLVHDMPDLQVVLNHVGGPLGIGPYAGRADEVQADWQHWIKRLASFPNVACKLGGLGMPMSGFRFHERPHPPGSVELAQAWGPVLWACIEAFGPDRCMFESNFPVDKGMVSYPVLWNALKLVTRELSPAERNRLFFDTANCIYRLNLQTGTNFARTGAVDASQD